MMLCAFLLAGDRSKVRATFVEAEFGQPIFFNIETLRQLLLKVIATLT